MQPLGPEDRKSGKDPEKPLCWEQFWRGRGASLMVLGSRLCVRGANMMTSGLGDSGYFPG